MGSTARGRAATKSLSRRALCHDLAQYVSAATLVTTFPDDVHLESEVRERFELVQNQLAQMRLLLQDCLEPPDHDERADVVAILRQCVETASVRLPIELDIELPRAELTGNQKVLRRAINNMLDNAIRATPGGGRVNVRISGTADLVALEVQDHGAGFGQIHAGHGLGMVSIADALSSFNGALEITSSPDEGTTVRLLLPRSTS